MRTYSIKVRLLNCRTIYNRITEENFEKAFKLFIEIEEIKENEISFIEFLIMPL